ncbi:potassium transporter Trk [Microbacterium lacus]|uniref:potassium transporter Trk n=1 Tax=Microbacterium lacus TaxID=415217 RepID=UPI003850A35C
MADEASVPESTPAAPRTRSDDRVETVSVRRAPKISVFLLLGAGLGVLVALILTFAFNGTDQISPNTGVVYAPLQVFGFLSLICISVGLIIGGSVALIFDRRATRNAREVTVDHTSVHTD